MSLWELLVNGWGASVTAERERVAAASGLVLDGKCDCPHVWETGVASSRLFLVFRLQWEMADTEGEPRH